MISVIIPSRNEQGYLEKTIASVLANAEGEIEVLAVLDGWVPDPQIQMSDARVIFIHNEGSIGQRQAINQAAKMAKGEFIMKLDAHCAVDKGFDVILARDCEYDMTMVPRMYNLNVDTWEPKRHKKTDYMYIGWVKGSLRAQYYQGRDEEGKRIRPPSTDKMIDDIMCCMGPCFFMHKERFWELGGCDENHGGWGQQGIEVACKAWLSGGRLVVNKNTWFAHWFRGGGVPEGHKSGFPYSLSGKLVAGARNYSNDLWTNNKWEQQVRDFQWLLDKFEPPRWKMNDLAILFYSANAVSKKIMNPVMRSLKKFGYPIISVTQEPTKLGTNILVPKERSLQNIYKQVLIAAKKATTKYVALCEDDCLYTPEHFQHVPIKPFAYNKNRWLLHLREGLYSYRDRPILSQCIADREALIKTLEERFALPEPVPDKFCGEMGVFDEKIGIPVNEYEMFESKNPSLIICHRRNITGRKFLGEDAPSTTEIPHWGKVGYWLKKFRTKDMKDIITPRRQHSHIASVILDVDYIHNNRMLFCYTGKEKRLQRFMRCFPPYLDAVISNYGSGKKHTGAELKEFEYYEYLLSTRHPAERGDRRGVRRTLFLMWDLANLYKDIRENGLKNPLDMWVEGEGNNKRYVLYRGGRRLEILKSLGYDKVACRVFKSKNHFRQLSPSVKLVDDDSINRLAQKQFQRHNQLATDKYWVHQYTPLYDTHIGAMRNKAKKILEMGVFRGASLLLWKEAFPNAHIYGVDNKPRKDMMVDSDDVRLTVFTGDQHDELFMKDQVVSQGPFDVIIDDAGHKPLEMRRAFSLMWASVTPGGWYVIEDLYGNYRSNRVKHTIMEHLKSMIDEMNIHTGIKAMHFYYNICFIQRGF